MTLGSDTRTTLILGFWPQGRMTVVESDIMFFSNKDVYEEFAMNELYIGPTRNWLTLLFRVGIDCYECYMVIVRACDKKHL